MFRCTCDVRGAVPAPDRVDQVVVVEVCARRQMNPTPAGVDERGGVDDNANVVGEHAVESDLGIAGPRCELVKPDALHEERLRVHDRDVDGGAAPKPVGRHRAGVARAEDDHAWPLRVDPLVVDPCDAGGVHDPAFRRCSKCSHPQDTDGIGNVTAVDRDIDLCVVCGHHPGRGRDRCDDHVVRSSGSGVPDHPDRRTA